jgi:hypothetical protein
MALPDAPSDGPTVLPEEAALGQRLADVQFLRPSGARSDASDGVRPVASLTDANPAVHLALRHPAVADAGRSAVHEQERAEAEAALPDEPELYRPDAVPSAERSGGAEEVRRVPLVHVAWMSGVCRACHQVLTVTPRASLPQELHVSPLALLTSQPRPPEFLPREPEARPQLASQAQRASRLRPEVPQASPPSMEE